MKTGIYSALFVEPDLKNLGGTVEKYVRLKYKNFLFATSAPHKLYIYGMCLTNFDYLFSRLRCRIVMYVW